MRGVVTGFLDRTFSGYRVPLGCVSTDGGDLRDRNGDLGVEKQS